MNIVAEQSTIPGLIRNIVANIHPDTHTFMMHKVKDTWVEISYKEALIKIDAISAWFLNIGIQKGDRLALIMENGPDYVYYDQALQQIGAVNTSIYPTLSEAEIEYILNDSEARTILCGNPFLFRKVLKIANNCTSLIRIIPAFDDFEKFSDKVSLNAGVVGFKTRNRRGPAVRNRICLCYQRRPRSHITQRYFMPHLYFGHYRYPKGCNAYA
jgi:long-chain acyl-CoA synthetase